MMFVETWVRTPVSEALGWALFHSLWQGVVAAAILAVITARRSAQARYVSACAALVAILLCFVHSFWHGLPGDGLGWSPRRIPAPLAFLDASSDLPAAAALFEGGKLAWLTPFWLAGVVFFQMRMASGWLGTVRLRRRGVCDAPGPWKARLAELATRMRVSPPVQLVESGLASVPVVVGHLRPVILLPAGLLLAMSPAQIEAILLHELAHIRRHDYLVNLLQTAVEGLLFYHPAVWWISALIRAEREHCCDDLAVAASSSGSAHQYASALAALEQSRCAGTMLNRKETAAIAATGGSLMKRIQRLLHPVTRPAPANGWAVTPVIVVVVLASLAALRSTAAPQADGDPDPYLRWLNEDVTYIIETGERDAFLGLKTNEERKHFIGQFWLRRDPTPGTSKNEFQEEHYRRIAYANERFVSPVHQGWKTDRGKIYIVYGPPDEIESHPSGRQGGPPSEQWLYEFLEGIGRRVIVEFLDSSRDGEYRQTRDPSRKR